MFEDSLMESGGKIKTKSKYWMIATLRIQRRDPGGDDHDSAAVSRSVAEERDDGDADSSASSPAPTSAASASAIVKPMKMVSEIDPGLHAPTKIPKDIKMVKEEAAPPPAVAGVAGMSGMGGGSGVPGGVMGGVGTAPPGRHVARPSRRADAGFGRRGCRFDDLAVEPGYPPIARAAHVSGTVVLHAIISKKGTIEKLTVVSGPPMLQAAAHGSRAAPGDTSLIC